MMFEWKASTKFDKNPNSIRKIPLKRMRNETRTRKIFIELICALSTLFSVWYVNADEWKWKWKSLKWDDRELYKCRMHTGWRNVLKLKCSTIDIDNGIDLFRYHFLGINVMCDVLRRRHHPFNMNIELIGAHGNGNNKQSKYEWKSEALRRENNDLKWWWDDENDKKSMLVSVTAFERAKRRPNKFSVVAVAVVTVANTAFVQ